ncbi:MAG: hypothetical protein JKX75_05840 [Gammaproteobacteria bacterium]|nr:hypothetical protein [Gammaproteobacteria bacterium]
MTTTPKATAATGSPSAKTTETWFTALLRRLRLGKNTSALYPVLPWPRQ